MNERERTKVARRTLALEVEVEQLRDLVEVADTVVEWATEAHSRQCAPDRTATCHCSVVVFRTLLREYREAHPA